VLVPDRRPDEMAVLIEICNLDATAT
jgi:hypothetical protein